MKNVTRDTRPDRTPLLLVAIAVIAMLRTLGHAQDVTASSDKIAEVDEIFSWATPSTPGCACAVSLHGKVVVNRAYGSADLERDVPITPDSIFDAGSLQKQFVAAAVLLLVEEKRISLADDVRRLVPELPDFGRTITVDHLLTHTSGLRDWTAMMPLAAGKERALTLILRQRGLNFAPGEEMSYSNSGFVLAKEIVARASGTSFGEFARQRLFEPLGMKSTSYREDMREVIRKRALAYDKRGDRWRMAMLLDDDRGGGGLLSTAGDLVVWNDALTNDRLGAFVTAKMQEPAKLSNGRKLGYGRGLFINTTPAGETFFWHGGSADGYKSALARFPAHGLSIAIMCNSGDDTDRVAFARRILEIFVPAASSRRAETRPEAASGAGIEVAAHDLGEMAGLFFSERTGEPLQLVVHRGSLRVAGGPPLVATSKDRFRCSEATLQFMSGDEFELHFQSPDRLELTTMEGRTTPYRRAQPRAPTPDDLRAFAGRYGNDEIGTVFQIQSEEDSLVMRLEHAPARTLSLKPVDRDTFQFSRMMVRFRRDDGGKVVGFDYTNPMLRNVRFTREPDRK
jgi:CubicO group peptidase (beta-lactamase class C family)